MARRVFAYLWLDGVSKQSRELIMLHKPSNSYEREQLGVPYFQVNVGGRGNDVAMRFIPPQHENGRVIFTGQNAGGAGVFDYPSAAVSRILLTEVEVDEDNLDWHGLQMKMAQI